MAYHLPMRVDGPADPLDRARELDELRRDPRPLIALAVATLVLVVLGVAMAVLGPIPAPVDARSTSATTAEPVPAVQPVDMRPPRAVPLPPVVTPVRR
jgi:hypothetical protein